MGWTPDDDSFHLQHFYTDYKKKGSRLVENLARDTTPLQWTIWGGTAVTCFVVGFTLGRTPPLFRRFATVQDIPKSYFNNTATHRWLRGRVVSVTDGDTVRVRHIPTLLHQYWDTTAMTLHNLTDTTWSIRLCTIDTPETAKFGKPGQPFGVEAKDRLQRMLLHQIVQVRLLERDQYGRAVAEVRRKKWLGIYHQYADEAMLRAGLAEVYEGASSSAVYGRLGKEAYLTLQQQAQAAKRGIWSVQDRETAAAYKARTKK